MDFATIIGIIGGFGLVIIAMVSGGGFAWFVDWPSAMIVFGGTFGAVLINYPISDLLGVIKVAKNAFRGENSRQTLSSIDLLKCLKYPVVTASFLFRE